MVNPTDFESQTDCVPTNVDHAALAEAQALAGLGCFQWDLQTNEIVWSDELFKIFGLSRVEHVPSLESFIQRVHPEDRLNVQKSIQQAIESKGKFEHAERIVLPGGEIRFLESTGRVLTDSDGKPVSMVGACMDVTDRQRRQLEVESVSHRYQTIASEARLVVWELDPKTFQFTHVSDFCKDFLGFTPEQWCQPGFWVARVHPDDLQFAMAYCQACTTALQNHRFEYRMVHADGSLIWVEDVVNLVIVDDEVVSLRGVLIDITDRKELETQLRQSQKMEAVGLLAGGIAHDFNNLLTVISSYSQILHQDATIDSGSREYVSAIMRAATNAADLTRQLLLFSRKTAYQLNNVCLNELVKNSKSLLGRLLGEDIQLVTELAADLKAIRVDASMMEQVIMNLAVNSRDAMPSGGRIVIATHNQSLQEGQTIGDEWLPAGNYVVLSVSDSGCGIRSEDRERLFEPFFTTKGIEKGTGLGLSVVYGVVKECEGYIVVNSELGQGALFDIYLPSIVDQAGATDLAGTAMTAHGRETILLVEDDEAVRRVTVKALEIHGYTVIECDSSSEAIARMQEHHRRIDLVLTDVVMPDMHGDMLAVDLREIAPSVPVLFVSGYPRLKSINLEGPNNAYLEKPFTPKSLSAKVRQVLDAQSAETHTR